MATKFNIGDRVMTIERNEIRKGVVHKTFSDMSIMFIEFDDGEIEKVFIEDVVLDPVTEDTESQPEPENAPVEKSEITITPSEFARAVVETAAKECKGDITLGLMMSHFGAKLHMALFMTEVENA